MRVFTAALLFFVLAGAPAASAAGWKSAGTFGDPGNGAGSLSYGVDSAGDLTVLFRGRNIDDEITGLEAADRAPRGRISPSQTFPIEGPLTPELEVAPRGARTAVYATGPSGNRRIEFRSRGRADGAWSEPTVISQGHPDVQRTTLRTNANGQAVLVWFETPPLAELVYAGPNRSRYKLYASTRSSAGGTWSAPKVITEGFVTGFDVEIDDDGNALLAWADEGEKSVKTARRPAGGDFGAPVVHGEAGSVGFSFPTVAVAPNGRALATWQVGRPDGVGRGTTVVATGSTTTALSEPKVISRKGTYAGIAIDDRAAVVSWVENLGSSGRLKALVAGPRETPGDRKAITVSGKGLRGLAYPVTANGRIGFAWNVGTGKKSVVQVRTSDARGKLSPLQSLTKAGSNGFVQDVAVTPKGSVFVAVQTSKRNDYRALVARSSASTGRFSKPVTVAREKFMDLLGFMPPGRGESMLVSYIAGNWHLFAYE